MSWLSKLFHKSSPTSHRDIQSATAHHVDRMLSSSPRLDLSVETFLAKLESKTKKGVVDWDPKPDNEYTAFVDSLQLKLHAEPMGCWLTITSFEPGSPSEGALLANVINTNPLKRLAEAVVQSENAAIAKLQEATEYLDVIDPTTPPSPPSSEGEEHAHLQNQGPDLHPED